MDFYCYRSLVRAAVLHQRGERGVQPVPAAGHRVPVGALPGAQQQPGAGHRAAPLAHAQLARAEVPPDVSVRSWLSPTEAFHHYSVHM